MSDDERIKMYYQFGLLDWKSELYQAEEKRPMSHVINLAPLFDLIKGFSMLLKRCTTGLFKESNL